MKRVKLYLENNKKEIIKYFTIFIFLLLLCSLFPYSHDDWAWGSKIGIERLNTNFYNYNGRWISNLLVILLTRSYILRIIVSALILTINLLLIDKFVNSNKKIVKCFEILFLIAVPHLIFMQSVVWISGFTNYVFPTLLVLLYLFFNKNIINNNKYEKKSYLLIPLLFILGILSTLCVEHLTIYCVIISLFFCIYIFVKEKKIDLNNISYLIGSIVGSIIMFSNEAYHSIANKTDTYRNINPIINTIHNYFNDISKELIINNYLLNITISITLLILLYKKITNKKILKNIVTLILCFFPVYTIIAKISNLYLIFEYIKYVNGLFAGIYLISIFISLLLIFKKGKIFKYIFIYCSILLMTAPLLIVSPIGSRCFYSHYLLYGVLVLMLINEVLNTFKIKEKLEIHIKKIVLLIAIIFYLVYLMVYLNIFRIYNIRQRYLNQHLNDNEIILPLISSTEFVWNLNPANEEFNKRYKLFYKIKETTKVEFINYDEWKKVR